LTEDNRPVDMNDRTRALFMQQYDSLLLESTHALATFHSTNPATGCYMNKTILWYPVLEELLDIITSHCGSKF